MDIPGFLANRIQHALMREALWLVETGIASVSDVDAAVRYGFGFRFIAAGPFLQKDFSGLDTLLAAARTIYPDLCNARTPSSVLKSKVDQGHTGTKSGKGFYPWTEADWEREKKTYERKLRAALDILTGDEADNKPRASS
jgi:3-hydroxybutyryl-CoA dehydrogenase